MSSIAPFKHLSNSWQQPAYKCLYGRGPVWQRGRCGLGGGRSGGGRCWWRPEWIETLHTHPGVGEISRPIDNSVHCDCHFSSKSCQINAAHGNMSSIVYHLIIERYSMKTLHWYFPWATALHLYNMTSTGEKLQQLYYYHTFSDSLDIYLTKNHYENYSPKMVPIAKIFPN